MKKTLLLLTLTLLVTNVSAIANNPNLSEFLKMEKPTDSTRITALNLFWKKISQTVEEGDFEGYKSLYHEDAIVIFASGKNKTSMPISKALAGWKKGFENTKEGKQNDQVSFRFSQRIGNESTAHETGIFVFTSTNNQGEITAKHTIHFEMLFIKKDTKWYALMEYQKSNASQKEWEALK